MPVGAHHCWSAASGAAQLHRSPAGGPDLQSPMSPSGVKGLLAFEGAPVRSGGRGSHKLFLGGHWVQPRGAGLWGATESGQPGAGQEKYFPSGPQTPWSSPATSVGTQNGLDKPPQRLLCAPLETEAWPVAATLVGRWMGRAMVTGGKQ